MDPAPDRQLVTQLLQQWGAGDKQALDQLMPIVYDQLHKLASNCLRSERPDHTLRATALVHEAYLRLVDQSDAAAVSAGPQRPGAQAAAGFFKLEASEAPDSPRNFPFAGPIHVDNPGLAVL